MAQTGGREAESQERVVAFLREPRNYPHEAEPFAIRETHISRVFLAGEWAYKLKKAVSLGFLDYSTPELRRACCEEELRLNRRLAEGVYVGLASVCEEDGSLVLELGPGPAGRELETLVRMRRLPDDATLEALVERGEATGDSIDALVALLAPFYGAAPRLPAALAMEALAGLRGVVEANFEATRNFPAEVLPPPWFAALRSAQLSFLELRRDVLAERVRGGWVRDGHGDLRAEHVLYIPGCVVIDAIEFNAQYRRVDIAADVAFLRMDLERLGARDLAARFLERMARALGDEGLWSVLDFYTSYRAYVRGKVDGLTLRMAAHSPAARERLARRARRYFELARFHTLAYHRPRIVVLSGLSGTGKTTVGSRLAERLGSVLIRSDEVRKELAGLAANDRSGAAGVDGGIYSADHTRRTYEVLAERARERLREGTSVVLDATFSRRWQRDLAARVAQDAGAEIDVFECRVDDAIAAERLEIREREGRDASDATRAVRRAQRAAFEPFVPGEAVLLETVRPPDEVAEQALETLRRERP